MIGDFTGLSRALRCHKLLVVHHSLWHSNINNAFFSISVAKRSIQTKTRLFRVFKTFSKTAFRTHLCAIMPYFLCLISERVGVRVSTIRVRMVNDECRTLIVHEKAEDDWQHTGKDESARRSLFVILFFTPFCSTEGFLPFSSLRSEFPKLSYIRAGNGRLSNLPRIIFNEKRRSAGHKPLPPDATVSLRDPSWRSDVSSKGFLSLRDCHSVYRPSFIPLSFLLRLSSLSSSLYWV